jgi:hypothetical protein
MMVEVNNIVKGKNGNGNIRGRGCDDTQSRY